ncbi:MAG: nitroreductase [Cyclobacteriaceae bacterium]|nr:nitroreductase [Cyclobacteriaceae bacterium]
METMMQEVAVNPTMETIYQRRAVRKYKDQPVDPSLMEQIISAGRMAPTVMNRQEWKFYVLMGKKAIASLSPGIVKVASKVLNWAHGADPATAGDIIFHGAPAVIFITGPARSEWAAMDIGMCSQNIMLAAKSLGLDTCPIGLVKFLEKTDKFASLGIPKSEHIYLAIIVGYGDEQPEVHERKKDNIKFLTIK